MICDSSVWRVPAQPASNNKKYLFEIYYAFLVTARLQAEAEMWTQVLLLP